jgi:hypothetical protein
MRLAAEMDFIALAGSLDLPLVNWPVCGRVLVEKRAGFLLTDAFVPERFVPDMLSHVRARARLPAFPHGPETVRVAHSETANEIEQCEAARQTVLCDKDGVIRCSK